MRKKSKLLKKPIHLQIIRFRRKKGLTAKDTKSTKKKNMCHCEAAHFRRGNLVYESNRGLPRFARNDT